MDVLQRGPGSAPSTAMRQAGGLFYLNAAAVMLMIYGHPGRWALFVGISLANLAVAVALRMVPADRWRPRGMLALAALVFVGFAVSTAVSSESALIMGASFVLAFAWLGLHQPRRTILLFSPPVLVAYAGGLWVAGTPHELITSAFGVIPVACLVGVVISDNVSALRQAQAEIKAEERWRAAIMASLAHDVRSPLTSITGALELMTDDPETPVRHRRLLAAATRQAGRIMRLATGLLDVERVEQGRLKLDMYELQLLELVEEIVAGQSSITVQLDIEPGLAVWADRERLEQIIVNLLGNAARHGAPPVIVSASSGSTGVRISVRDHGPGVPETASPHLFERLGSADSSAQSVGLGLWIVRLLAEAHEGSVEYVGADPGAEFVVRLPRGPAVVDATVGEGRVTEKTVPVAGP